MSRRDTLFFQHGGKTRYFGRFYGSFAKPHKLAFPPHLCDFWQGGYEWGANFSDRTGAVHFKWSEAEREERMQPPAHLCLGVLLYSLTSLSCWINAICITGILPSNTVCPDILECATQIHNPNHPHVEQKTCGCTSWRNPPQQEYAVNDCRNQNKHKDPSLPENVGKPRFG